MDARMVRMVTMAGVALGMLVARPDLSPPRVQAAVERREITNASGSIDDLVARFLDALRRNDREALRALRVTRDEYIDVILSGSVPEGAPLRQWSPDANEYWWSVLHTKSVYSEANLLASYGGKPYVLKGVDYRKGVGSYATHRAYKQLSLDVQDEAGTGHEIQTGSIAEVNGKFKFISFVRD